MWSLIICTACQILGVSKNSDKISEECDMPGSEGNLEQIFDWKTGGKRPFRRPA
jgi:hypothetical protein